MEPMADRVLLLRFELCHRLARRIVGKKERVVPEAVVTAAFAPDHALAKALAHGHKAARLDKGDGARKPCRAPRVLDALELGEQLLVVCCIVAVRAGVARRIHAGLAVERIDHKTGIVRDGSEARLGHGGFRLDDGVLGKRRARFLGVVEIAELPDCNEPRSRQRRAQNLLDLYELVRIAGRDHHGVRVIERRRIDFFQCHMCLRIVGPSYQIQAGSRTLVAKRRDLVLQIDEPS